MILTIENQCSKSGSQFVDSILSVSGPQRDLAVLSEYITGNVPDFIKTLVDVTVKNDQHELIYSVLPDYLSAGHDNDYFRTPMSPITAQKIADLYQCCFPSRKMVSDIWKQATVKLTPGPLPPGPSMVTTAYFNKHNDNINDQLADLDSFVLGSLVAGHKKDVVVTPQLLQHPGNVAIYGWQLVNGNPIQGLNAVSHDRNYYDYSHGIRLVSRTATLDGQQVDLVDIFKDAALCGLISDEGPLTSPRYVI